MGIAWQDINISMFDAVDAWASCGREGFTLTSGGGGWNSYLQLESARVPSPSHFLSRLYVFMLHAVVAILIINIALASPCLTAKCV